MKSKKLFAVLIGTAALLLTACDPSNQSELTNKNFYITEEIFNNGYGLNGVEYAQVRKERLTIASVGSSYAVLESYYSPEITYMVLNSYTGGATNFHSTRETVYKAEEGTNDIYAYSKGQDDSGFVRPDIPQSGMAKVEETVNEFKGNGQTSSITYDMFENSFDKLSKTYKFTLNSPYEYSFEFQFFKGKIIYFSCQTVITGSALFKSVYNFAYETYVPVVDMN